MLVNRKFRPDIFGLIAPYLYRNATFAISPLLVEHFHQISHRLEMCMVVLQNYCP